MTDWDSSFVPSSVEEIETAWLKDCLKAARLPSADKLRSFTAHPTDTPGMTSTVHILSLDYDDDADIEPAKLVAKFSLDIEPVKQAFAANRGYEREVLFYKQFGANAGIPTPRCYWASYDPEKTTCGLILEYVEGTRSTNKFAGDADEMAPILDSVAAFHAKWWGKTDKLAGSIPGFAPFMVDLVLERLEISLTNIRKYHQEKVGSQLIKFIEFWVAHAHEIAEHERSKPQTLCHGDLHREQILFPATPGGPFSVIDWQMAGSDSAALDLSYLVSSGLRPELRAKHELEFLERYYEGLKTNGVNAYSMEDLLGSYKVGIARQTAFNMTAFSIEDLTPVFAWWDSSPDRSKFSFWDVTCDWATTALDEHQVLDELKRSI